MLRFTVLTENHEAAALENEHGLSLFLEYDRGNEKKNYLLDAGQSGVFARNAARLGIDLKEVTMAFLSHAHYDHAGGFGEFFQMNSKASVYAAAAGQRCDWYSMREDGPKYIGIPEEILDQYAERFVWIGTESGLGCEGDSDKVLCTESASGMWLVPHCTSGLEKIGEKTGMYRKVSEEGAEDCFVPEEFSHEQSLVVETENGLVIFNSCSHGGVANIVEEVRAAFPGRQICAYIGGFHLKAPGSETAMNCSEEEVRTLGRSLLELGIEHIYTGHCTGVRGYEILKEEMGECLQELKTGLRVEL